MRDVAGEEHARLDGAIQTLTRHLRGRGYEPVDTPLLEDTELFVRKSGGELTSRLYAFVDPGGNRVSLRPEFTSSVIRYFVEEGGSSKRPVRWQYQGPVFRHEPGGDGAYRQTTQVGAELIGAVGAEADGEVLSLAWDGLAGVGLDGYRMRVGHIGLLQEVVRSCGLSETAALFIVRNVPELKRGSIDVASLVGKAKDVGLLGDRPDLATRGGSAADGRDSAREYIQGVLAGTVSSSMGRRTPEQIVERLMRKVSDADSAERFEEAVSLVADLVKVEGRPSEALERVSETASARVAGGSAFEDLGSLFEGLMARGVDESRLVLDLGLVREIAYYTGVIFEIGHPSLDGKSSLCGGGRYDGLVKALGGDDVPALGFAYTVDHVIDAKRDLDSKNV